MRFLQLEERASFLSRPNRFQVKVLLQGREELAYLANPGRLWELLHPGTPLWLERAKNPEAKMKWQLVALEQPWGLIQLNTHRANDLVEWLLNAQAIAGLEGWTLKKREAKWGHSRFDFLLERGGEELWLEVKSCTLYSARCSQFPDAVTERGRKHLLELSELARQRVKTAVVILSQHPQNEFFLPDWHNDLAFAQTFLAVKDQVQLLPVAIHLNHLGEVAPHTRPLTIPWHILETHAKDEGAYLVLCRLAQAQQIEIGALGRLDFAAGYYLYVGSAKKNLRHRLARHQKRQKPLRWHLDYLTQHTRPVAALAVRVQVDLECALAQDFGALAQQTVPGFGCSDCACPSHLFFFSNNPLETPAFHDLLFRYRIEDWLPPG